MSKPLVITIGREYGSAGREIGRKLAADMGIKCYDKELLALASKESGMCEELFHNHDEKPTNSFLYSLVMDTYSMGYAGNTYTEMPINHKVFLAQFDAIKKIADEGPCVLVGRCADYILRDNENCMSVFISARMEDRIRRAVEYAHIEEKEAEEYIRKADKSRASYYNYYTDKIWGAAESYDLCISSSVYGIDETTAFIREFVSKR